VTLKEKEVYFLSFVTENTVESLYLKKKKMFSIFYDMLLPNRVVIQRRFFICDSNNAFFEEFQRQFLKSSSLWSNKNCDEKSDKRAK
jgi:hypothetical protein